MRTHSTAFFTWCTGACFGACIAVVSMSSPVRAQQVATLTTLHNFVGGADGLQPFATLVKGSDGALYGTTFLGGTENSFCTAGCGTVFTVTASGVEYLHLFDKADGAAPYGSLLAGADGNLYGSTSDGPTGAGTIFEITPSGTFSSLYVLGTQGATGTAYGGLLQGKAGTFFGSMMTSLGGTIYKFVEPATQKTLYAGQVYPVGKLVRGAGGAMYGVSESGGSTACKFQPSNGLNNDSGCGYVFKITEAGEFTVLYSFAGPDGAHPTGALVEGSDGDFYGTTSDGGNVACTHGCGTIFQVTASGVLTTLHFFAGADGKNPVAALMRDSAGNLYGTTVYGGSGSCYFNSNGRKVAGCGTVFKMSPSGEFTSLYQFQGTDGAYPYGGLVRGDDGNLYGTTTGSTVINIPFVPGSVFKLHLAPEVRITAEPASISLGQSTTVTWSSNGAKSCAASGAWSGSETTAGSVTLTPAAAGISAFTLTCLGRAGAGSDDETASVDVQAQ